MKKLSNYILILIVIVIIFIILKFYNSNKIIFDDIMIFGLWEDKMVKKEYEITTEKTVEIDVFTTINNIHKKIAPRNQREFYNSI